MEDEEFQQLDISVLFLNGNLRPGLKEERDYTIVPEAAYEVSFKNFKLHPGSL